MCWHKWKVVTYRGVDVYQPGSTGLPIRVETHVSMVCEKCGWPRVHVIDGIWDLEC